MQRQMLKSKIHRATVTGCDVDYVGSITVDPELMASADLLPNEQVHVWDIAPLWWNPPDQWLPGQPVTIDVPDVPIRQFVSWQARFSAP